MKLGIVAIGLGLTMIIASIALADVPGSINYQGRLADSAGVPLNNVTNNAADGWIDLIFRIVDAETGGTQVWGQTNYDVAVNNGLFSVLLNNLGTNTFPASAQVNRWLEVEVITNGVVRSILAPRKELSSVPYALRAGDAQSLDKILAQDLRTVLTSVTNVWTNVTNMWLGVTNALTNVSNIWVNVTNIWTNFGLHITNMEASVTNLEKATNSLQAQLNTQFIRKWSNDFTVGQLTISNNLVVKTNLQVVGTAEVANIVVLTNELWMNGTNIISSWPHGSRVTNLNADMLDGLHASSFLTNEVDPQVSLSNDNYLAKWASTTLVEAAVLDSGTNVAVLTHLAVASNLVVSGSVSMGTNQLWVMGTNIITNWVHANIVWNLNADMLDGLHASNLISSITTNIYTNLSFYERDPQVDDNMAQNVVSRWRGTNLTGGSIVNFDNGNVGIGLRTNDQPRGRLDVRSATDWYLLALDQDGSHHSYLRAGNPDNGVVIIGDQQTERTVIQPSVGKVGIGTYHPDGKLDVRSANNWYLLALDQDGSHHSYLRAGNPDNGVVIIGDQQTERTVIQPISGKVGIGTYFPAATLDVNGYSIFSGILTINRDNGQLRLAGGAYNGGLWTGGGKLFLANWDTGAGAVVDLQNGNVGIGTTDPQYKLDVNGQARVRQALTVSGGDIWLDADATVKAPGGRLNIQSATWQALSLNPAGGNVGIGTPAPDYKLDVNGDARIRNTLLIGKGVGDFRIQTATPDHHFPWNNYQIFALRAYEDFWPPQQDRTVLVPAFAGFRITDHLNRWPNFEFKDNGQLWVKTYPVEYSDSKIKLDQSELDYGLEQVMALKPKRYNNVEWKQDMQTGNVVIHSEKKKNDIGLVAQDIQGIIPEAVVVPEQEGDVQLLGIAYPKLIPVLIKAIQDQQKQIEKLEDKVKHLEKRVGDK